MKQLVCEMCGGTDIIKKDGVFVCQHCGLKYSLEEAKKLLIEVSGTIDVSGSTVKIDQSQRLDNLISAARLSTESKNYETAAEQWAEIQALDPQNWEACYYSTHCKALINKLGHYGPNDSDYSALKSTIHQALKLIENKEDDYEKRELAIYTLQSGVNMFISAGINEGNRLDQIEKDYNSNSIDRGYWRHQMVEAGKLYCELGESVYLIFKPDTKFYDKAIELISTGIDKIDFSNAKPDFEYTEFKNLRNRIVKEKEEKENKRRSDEFWSKHTEKKEALENEKRELDKKIDTEKRTAQSEIDKLKNKKKGVQNIYDDLEEQIQSLKKSKSSLGILDFKKRDAINVEINKLIREQKEEQEKRNQIDDQIKAVREQRDNSLKPIYARRDSLDRMLKSGKLE